jgi:peptidyl-prolyl cis-trans isomerase B (cyclophilin B)
MQKVYLFLLPLFALALLVGCEKATAPGDNTTPTVTDDKTDTSYEGPILSGKYTVTLKTSLGDIIAELNADAAPKTVTNFIELAKQGYYDDLTFHRVIPEFMVQGGDPNGNGTGGQSIYGDTFEDEINADSYKLGERMLKDEAEDQILPNELADVTVKEYYEKLGFRYNDKLQSLPMKRGSLAMANRGPNTNGSQFFIIQRGEGTPWLEGKHTVFGNVIEGMDIVDAMIAAERGPNDAPVEPITFTVEVE